jgi:hypothetical protein
MQHDNKITRNIADAALKIMMGEEPDNQEFTQELEKNKVKASTKKSPEDEAKVAKGNVDAVETVKEELKGGQKNIDMNKNGKIDAEDFKMLRKKKPAKRVVHSDKPDSLVSMKVSKEEVEELEEGKLKDMVTGHMDAGHDYDTAVKKAQADLDKMEKPKAKKPEKPVQKEAYGQTGKPDPAMADAFKKLRAGGSRIQDKPSNTTKTSTGLIHKAKLAKGPKYGVTDFTKNVEDSEAEGPKGSKRKSYGARQNKVRSTRVSGKDVNESFGFSAMLESYKEKGLGFIKEMNEEIELLDEKNKPTNPALWARAKAAAKSKFDVYPSAYANGWAAKWYKKRGGSWKSVKEEVELEEGKKKKKHDCASKVKSEEYGIGYCIPEMHTMLEDGTVTHYDVEFDDHIVEDFPVEELEILVSEMHEHYDNEEKNQLHELSPKTLGSYTKKASQDLSNRRFDQGESEKRQYEPDADDDREEKKLQQREKGIKRAATKLVKKATNEEAEQIDEATPTKKEVKQGIGIARDKRYAKGNMTGAVKAMDKVNKGIAQHPAVAKELRKQNESSNFKDLRHQLDELSPKTLGSYAQKSVRDLEKRDRAMGKATQRDRKVVDPETSKPFQKMAKRRSGLAKAVNRLSKEETEQLDELSPKTLGSYAKKAQRQTMNTNMAIGANSTDNPNTRREKAFAKKRKEGASRAIGKLVQKKMSNEDVEQIDELKSKTLKSYISKAGKDLSKRVADYHSKDIASSPSKIIKRDLAIDKAKGRLSMNRQLGRAEESVQEDVNEKTMTDAQMDKREKIVMAMKPKMQGFKDRYGDDAKSVMYATATKQAMKD